MRLFKSITSRIIFLHIVAVIVTAVVMPLVLYLFMSAAVKTVHLQAIRGQAEWVARHLHYHKNGEWSFDLPDGLRDIFSPKYGRYAYAVIDDNNRVLFSTRDDMRPIFPIDVAGAEVQYGEVPQGSDVIEGATVRREIDGQWVWVQLGEALNHPNVLLDDVVRGFLQRVGWITIPLLFLLLATDIIIVRQAIRPLLRASKQAEEIGPARTDIRLQVDDIPTEILPLVQAVNRAFDRMEQGITRQREFAADVAHELRTPLAVLRTRIETMPEGSVPSVLYRDIEGMSRVVSQLLDSADLETLLINSEETADLRQVCAETAEFVAPLAVAQDKAISLTGWEGPVWVQGNAEMLRRAIRNLLENAIFHTPPCSSVEVVVEKGGCVKIIDEGEGVPVMKRELIFERFWRRDRERSQGAGLGLSIVKRIIEAHGGTIAVNSGPAGGAEFSIQLLLAKLQDKPLAAVRSA